MATTKQREDRR